MHGTGTARSFIVSLSLRRKLDAEGVVVDDFELLGLLERAGGHLEGREAADRDRAVEATT